MTFLIDNWQQVLRESLVLCSRISVLMQSCFTPFKLRDLLISECNLPPSGTSFPPASVFFHYSFWFAPFSICHLCYPFMCKFYIFRFCNLFFHLISISMTGVEFRQLPTPSASSAVSTLGLSAYRWIDWFMSKRGTNRRSPSSTNPAAFFRRRGDALRPEV